MSGKSVDLGLQLVYGGTDWPSRRTFECPGPNGGYRAGAANLRESRSAAGVPEHERTYRLWLLRKPGALPAIQRSTSIPVTLSDKAFVAGRPRA